MDIEKIPPQVKPYMPVIPGLYGKCLARTSGKYYGHFGATQGTTTQSVVANYLYVVPFLVLVSETFDRIGIYIDTGAAGNGRLGIYADNGSQAPGTLVLDAGVVDTTTAGSKEIVINQTLDPGLYWLAVVYDATPKHIVNNYSMGILGLGSDAPGLYVTGASVMYRTSQSYGALPNPHPTPTSGGAGLAPCLMLRRA